MKLVAFVLLTVVLTSLYADAATAPPDPVGLRRQSKKCYYDIGLLIDDSSSITTDESGGQQNWVALQKFLKGFVETMMEDYPDGRMALTTFSELPENKWMWSDSTNKQLMLDKIDGMKNGGRNTFMKKGFQAMQRVFKDSTKRKAPSLLLFMTDGKPNPKDEDPTEIAEEMKRDGVRIISVGVTKNADAKLLKKIGHTYIPIRNYLELAERVENIVEQTCTFCDVPGECNYDIALLLDDSGSITVPSAGGQPNWIALQEFLKELLTDITTLYPKVNVAMVAFAENSRVFWNWEDGSQKDRWLRIIDSFSQPEGGSTYMKDAFVTMRDKIFAQHKSNRENLMLFLTDGKPWPPKKGHNPLKVAQELKDRYHVNIFSIGITKDVDWGLLKQVSSNNAYFYIRSYPELQSYVRNIIARGCSIKTSTCPRIYYK